ncbi:hypothetical protein CFFPNG_03260 [Methylorubrum aminovorans]
MGHEQPPLAPTRLTEEDVAGNLAASGGKPRLARLTPDRRDAFRADSCRCTAPARAG